MILNLQNIYKDYQQEKLVVPVLKDVSLTVEEGEPRDESARESRTRGSCQFQTDTAFRRTEAACRHRPRDGQPS